MRFGSYRVDANWGLIAFSGVLLLLGVIYFFDAYSTSNDTQNLLLVAPATALLIVIFFVIVKHEIRLTPLQGEGPAAEETGKRFNISMLRTPALMATVGIYILGISYIGFDISTFLFISVSLAIQGERRPLLLVGYSAVFSILVVLGMKALLPFPVPTVLF